MRLFRNTTIFIVVFFLQSLSGCGVNEKSEADGTVYFMVSRPGASGGDSYILPLTRPQDIAGARAIVKNPLTALATIVLARIDRGSGDGNYLNKDLIGKRTWSWRVVEFQGFTEITAEILDGSPTDVEQRLNEWLTVNNGMIGFWSYAVTREVPLAELR
ncbi:MAG: hypothetical protein FJ215_08755 [Ignavibacteria bacterium]|nr:hypothetical protein [Ignavibacteria bacterium]